MTRRVRVITETWETPLITSYDLRLIDGGQLPAFTAGAHIDLMLPNELIRSYSLTNPQSERHRYVIAVQKDRASRGGSKWVHEALHPGNVLVIDGPRNNFVLNETVEKSILIAGGIGITPLLCMADRLSTLKRNWELIYCSRRRVDMAFIEILARFGERVRFNFDEEPGGKMLDIAAIVRAATANAHFYCCGPLPMLAAFEAATAELPRERIHVEYFSAKQQPAVAGGFKVVLAKSGREFTVPPSKSILDTLLDAGLDIPYSCKEGVCGSCETKVLEGAPDHRDLILTPEERDAGKTMMICCSGSKREKLVLDL
ncbi:MAG: 2Fe-2S iron-sulfur cluster binding domain-containing protein [Rhizobiales bacterium]|nr:2Fe-2S iron-sulfur cluster binding domain-containing protein [Hyphomicrobiales bacterium]